MGNKDFFTLVVFDAEPPFAVEPNLGVTDSLIALEGLWAFTKRGHFILSLKYLKTNGISCDTYLDRKSRGLGREVSSCPETQFVFPTSAVSVKHQ